MAFLFSENRRKGNTSVILTSFHPWNDHILLIVWGRDFRRQKLIREAGMSSTKWKYHGKSTPTPTPPRPPALSGIQFDNSLWRFAVSMYGESQIRRCHIDSALSNFAFWTKFMKTVQTRVSGKQWLWLRIVAEGTFFGFVFVLTGLERSSWLPKCCACIIAGAWWFGIPASACHIVARCQ